MNIPTFDFSGTQLIDEKGYATPAFSQFMDNLNQLLILNAGPEGLVVPSLTTAQIALLTNSPNGTIVYDSTLNNTSSFKGNVNGTFKTFTVT